ncbi:MAG: hypothetical protein CL868_10220 [Cytophagaceae bacterium]|nr:hypothetical protein [Cytophagaceae bacterium]
MRQIYLIGVFLITTFIANAQTISLGKDDTRMDYTIEEFENQGNDFGKWISHYSDDTYTFHDLDSPPTTNKCSRKSSYEKKKKCLSEYIQSTVMNRYRVENAVKHGWVKLKLRFKIDEEGDVVDIVVEGSTDSAQKEAIKVLRGLRQLNPAIKDGKPVKIVYSMPIVAYVN